MLDKKNIINALFIASFPVYGIGSYFSASQSPSMGYLISIVPHTAILIFYMIDLVYRKEFQIRVNKWYLVMWIFLISSVASLFVALNKHLPESNELLTITKSLMVIIPFQAFVVVHLYNEQYNVLVKLTFISLSVLLFINLIGYFVFRFSNELHSIEGRINFPFLDGIYSGSSLIAIISLMLLYYFRDARKNIVSLTGWLAYLSLSLVLLFLINSRITILVFLLVLFVSLFNIIGKNSSIYWLSLFTIPILLSTGILIYEILNMPIFIFIIQRVDIIDVSTFNGRAFLWQDVLDWLLHDRQGLMFGNGYRGHYFFYLISDVAKMWNERELHHLHLHSSSLEILVCQGLIIYLVYLLLFYRLFKYYQMAYREDRNQGVFFTVVIFLLFIMQVDTFLYMESLGALIFSWLASAMVMRSAPFDTSIDKLSIDGKIKR